MILQALSIRCYAELNDFLPENKRYCTFSEELTQTRSLKDQIESLGIPHTEIDLVLVDGQPAPFSTGLTGGERISLYPRFHQLPVGGVSLVRPPAPNGFRFLLDVHLGKLTSLLRMLGFDAMYQREASDASLAIASVESQRVLLTRDRGLLKRSLVTHGYLVRSGDPDEQLSEVLRRFELLDHLKPFTRCMVCNGPLLPISKEQIEGRLPPKVRAAHDTFLQCAECKKVYWRGTHFKAMVARIERIRRSL